VRRTKAEAAVTREQLLDAAERVFRERGVASTSLGEVAAAAGVTRGAVYWHFRDKVDLLGALCERATLPLDAIFEQVADNCGDPLDALRRTAIAALTTLAGDPRAQGMFQLVFQTCGSAAELAPLASTKERERGACLTRVERLVERAIAAGQLPADTDAALAAHALHAYVMGLMQAWVQQPQSFDLAAAAPALIDAMVTGLTQHPPRHATVTAPGLPTAA
jgi:TetR/AcrR family transcriptional regulator, acrAB operon repressor